MKFPIFLVKKIRTKLFLSLAVFTLISLLGKSQTVSSLYTISYPASLPKEVVSDIQSLLSLSTGRHWDITQQPQEKGVILNLKTDGDYKTGESCLVNSDGASYLKFDSPTTNGLIYGVYKYLRDQGFRFYLPDSLYTIIPTLRSIYKKTSSMETPFLRIRDFFGTGGFGSGKTDPDHSVENAWKLWKWRNGFGSEFVLGGHVGESFNLQNAKVLQSNPGWTASPIMKNGKIDPSTKLNYYNSAAVNFFTDWVIRKYTNSNYQPPPPYMTDMVSIEPADAGGYITNPPQGSDLKSISDQVFNAANVAAQKLDRLFPNRPNIGVNLYAYSTHADIPDFNLNPRVFVQIIPYQYQNIAFAPAFIKRWSKKVKRFGIYDYFKFPDGSWDMPGTFTIDELMKRELFGANNGSEGTTYESSYSKFATAIPLWVLCQYTCTGDPDWQKYYNELISDLYGNAAPPIKDLFDIFYRQTQFNLGELNQALNDIQKAGQLTNDRQVLNRINELKLYLCYAYLRLKSQDLATGDLETRMLPIEKIAWTLYDKKIIDSYRIMQLTSYSFYAKPPDPTLVSHYHDLQQATFPETNGPNILWKKDYVYSPNEMESLLNTMNGSRTNASRVAVAPVTAGDEVAAAIDSYQPKQNITFKGTFRSRGYFDLFSEKPGQIVITWSLTASGGSPPTATISGADKNYKEIYDYALNSASGKLSVSVPAGESYFFIDAGTNVTYILQLQLNGSYCYFEPSPWAKLVFLNEKGMPAYAPPYFPSYIYVPKDLAEVQYRVQGNFLKVLDPEGNPVTTTLVKQLDGGIQVRSFAVPPKFSGKFWQAVIPGIYYYQFSNIPDRYFLFTKK